VNSAILATVVADWCIKSSTQPCNLHRQTLAVEWSVLKSPVKFNLAPHRMPPFQQVGSSNFRPARAAPRSTVSAVIVKWERLGATTAQPRSGRPHKLTEQNRRVLKRVPCKNRLSSVATLTSNLQTASGSNVSTRTVRRELHEMLSMAKQPNTSL
jgi:hypothetical protein